MVKTKINSECEDLQISRLNEFFLVADRIRKAGRDVRQGLGKFKCSKPNPSPPPRQATRFRLSPTVPLIR
ncbi:unnamed protein product [Sphagnum balticum]